MTFLNFKKNSMDFKKHFSSVTDPRVVGRIFHLLSDIIGLSIIAVMAGCEGYDDIHSPSVSLIDDTAQGKFYP